MSLLSLSHVHEWFQQGAFSEKDEALRQIIAKLDAIDSPAAISTLTVEDLTAVRRQLAEGQSLVRDTVDRLRQSQEEGDMVTRRRDELEGRLASLETEYEELLEKTIHDEETSNVDIAESMADLKVCSKVDSRMRFLNQRMLRINLRYSTLRNATPMLARFKTLSNSWK